MIDLHCHILPGIDDGPVALQESLAMCRQAAADGIRVIVATPHRGSFAADTEGGQVFAGIKKLKKALRRNRVPLRILPGHELHISRNLIDDINTGRALTINHLKKHVLLELPFRSVPFYVPDVIGRLKEKGITPIIAHAERNTQIQSDPRVLKRLIKQGALAQITGGSLLNEFGPAARAAAVEMLKKGLAQVMSSDGHSLKRPAVLSAAVAEAAKIIGEKGARALVEDNPAKIIKGEALTQNTGC